MARRLKRMALILAAFLFLFALMRIGTSVYENHIRSIGGVPYAR